MKPTRKRNSHYLLVKLNARDWKYLIGFRKYESPKHVRSMEKYLGKVVSLHIMAIFVMTSALMLEADKKITRKKAKSMVSDLDKDLASFVKIINRVSLLTIKKEKGGFA